MLSFIDNNVFKQVANWLRKEHRNKNWSWINKTYHKQSKGRFSWGSTYERKDGEIKWVELFRMVDIPVRYHTKIRSEANPYDKQYADYFRKRAEINRKTAIRDRVFLSSDAYVNTKHSTFNINIANAIHNTASFDFIFLAFFQVMGNTGITHYPGHCSHR